jgi:hypothetical protein
MRNSLVVLVLVLGWVSPFPAGRIPVCRLCRLLRLPSRKQGILRRSPGENLGRDSVAELYLTDSKKDVKVVIVEETDDSILFRVPAGVDTDRLALLVLTTGQEPTLIEEPMNITIQ